MRDKPCKDQTAPWHVKVKEANRVAHESVSYWIMAVLKSNQRHNCYNRETKWKHHKLRFTLTFSILHRFNNGWYEQFCNRDQVLNRSILDGPIRPRSHFEANIQLQFHIIPMQTCSQISESTERKTSRNCSTLSRFSKFVNKSNEHSTSGSRRCYVDKSRYAKSYLWGGGKSYDSDARYIYVSSRVQPPTGSQLLWI